MPTETMEKPKQVVPVPPPDPRALALAGIEQEDSALAELSAKQVETFLGAFDGALPAEFEGDIMGQELLAHLDQYARLTVALKAARHTRDHKEAEQFKGLVAYHRLAASIIQASYPEAKRMASELAQAKAIMARRERAKLLATQDDD